MRIKKKWKTYNELWILADMKINIKKKYKQWKGKKQKKIQKEILI